MAFDQTFFAPIGAISAEAPTMYGYKSADTIETVTTTDYFILKRNELTPEDLVYASLADGERFLVVEADRSSVRLMSVPSADFFFDVSRGKIDGLSPMLIGAINQNVGPGVDSFVDVWGGPGDMVYPTGAESWEVLSDNVNDTSAGTGAQTITVLSLDTSNVLQTPLTVSLNGTTPVAIPGTHAFPAGAAVASQGAGTDNNLGNITIRVSGAGNIRTVIPTGLGASKDTHYRVRAGTTAYLKQTIPFYSKDQNGDIRGLVRFPGTTPWLTGAEGSFYQNNDVIESILTPAFPPGTDIRFQASSLNAVQKVTIFTAFIVEEIV